MSMRWTVCATLTALLCLCVADGSAVEPEDCKARPTAFQTIQKGIEATSEETTAQTKTITPCDGADSAGSTSGKGGSAGYSGVGISGENDAADANFSLSPALSLPLGDAYAVRSMPDHYTPAEILPVSLSLMVNPANPPSSVVIREQIPPGVPQENVTAPSATIGGGWIIWTFAGPDVESRTIPYALKIPGNTTQGIRFSGNVLYDTASSDITGQDVVYAIPAQVGTPRFEMLMAAHLSWRPPPQEGVASYNVYRSVDGSPWQKIGCTEGLSYVDSAVVPGKEYSYKVSAVSESGIEGPASMPTGDWTFMLLMAVREAEDFNYDGGKYAGYRNCTATLEAPLAGYIETPPDYDYWHPNTGGPRDYRPNDEVGIETALDYGTTDVWHTSIGWIDPGSWYRYTFDVTEPGWIKLTFRVASPSQGTIAAYCDETFAGMATFSTGNAQLYTWVAIQPFEEKAVGEHTVRVMLLRGEMCLDKIAIGYNWSPPWRQTIWYDDFEKYNHLYVPDDLTAAGWTIRNHSGIPDAAWRLWRKLTCELPPCQPAVMIDNFVVAHSDLAPDAQMNEELISPAVDCAFFQRIRLNFTKSFRVHEDDPEHLQVAEVDIRTYDRAAGWGDWINLLRFDRLTVEGEDFNPESLDIPEYADGKKIQIRWRFHDAKSDFWFAIDQVRLSGEPWERSLPVAHMVSVAGGKATLTWWAPGWRRFTVEQASDLPGGTWVNVPGFVWPITWTTWTSEDISDTKRLFYRVVVSE
jgi:hypothetical protein